MKEKILTTPSRSRAAASRSASKNKNKSFFFYLKFHSLFITFFSVFSQTAEILLLTLQNIHASMIPHAWWITNILKIWIFPRKLIPWNLPYIKTTCNNRAHFLWNNTDPCTGCLHTGCWDWQVWTVSDPCQLMNGYRLMGQGQRSEDSLTRE